MTSGSTTTTRVGQYDYMRLQGPCIVIQFGQQGGEMANTRGSRAHTGEKASVSACVHDRFLSLCMR